MAGFQKVTLIGYIGRMETSYTPSGMAVTNFSIATSKKIKGEEVTSWHKLVAFDKRAEIIAQYHDKGSQIHIEGELQYGQYDKDGVTRYTTDIIVNQFSFVGSKQGNGQNQNRDNNGQSQQNQGYQSEQQDPNQGGGFQGQQNQDSNQTGAYNGNSGGGFNGPPDDDIPFSCNIA